MIVVVAEVTALAALSISTLSTFLELMICSCRYSISVSLNLIKFVGIYRAYI